MLVWSKEHESDLRSKKMTNALARHWVEGHNDPVEPPKFSYEVIKQHSTSLERQLQEALTIDSEEFDILLHERGKRGMNLIPNIQMKT